MLLHGQGRKGGGWPHKADIGIRQGRCWEGEGDGSGMDIVTLIDCNFGTGNSWLNFASVEVMDPVPMFVGDIDGARRHVVSVGLTLLGQPRCIRSAKRDDNYGASNIILPCPGG